MLLKLFVYPAKYEYNCCNHQVVDKASFSLRLLQYLKEEFTVDSSRSFLIE